eukprot:scaffold10544_cov105-Isochrysis_galbana.AAC.1
MRHVATSAHSIYAWLGDECENGVILGRPPHGERGLRQTQQGRCCAGSADRPQQRAIRVL